MRNSLFLWCTILLLGTVLSHLYSDYYAIIAFIIWIILFLKDVRIDPDKAFSKYRKRI